jgi:D-aspartate ligase
MPPLGVHVRTQPKREARRVPTATDFDTSIPVLVVKVGRYPRHHGGLGAVRTAGRVGIPAFAMTEDRFTPVAMSRYLTGRTVSPLSGLEPTAQLVERVRRAVDRVGTEVIALPTDDEAAILIAEHRDALGPRLIAPPIPPSLPRRLASKRCLLELCERHSTPTAGAAFLVTPDDFDRYARTARYPVVAKVVEPFRRLEVPTIRSPTLFRSEAELLGNLDRQLTPSYLMLQEYLPPETSEDWIFQGYFDASSECLVGFTGVKYRSWPPQFGITTFATTAANEALAAKAIAFCRAVRYCGIVDMDWRLDQRDGEYHLLDCNPRVGAQFRLFENAASIDVVRAMHLDLTGRSVPEAPMRHRSFVVEHLDLASRLSRADRSARNRARPRRGPIERAWFAPDDPVPFVSMMVRQVVPTYKYALRRVTHNAARDRHAARRASRGTRA